MKLNERIAYARKKAGLSQIDLADLLGVSRQSVSKWETGEANPDINKIPELAKTLNVSIDWLFSEESIEQDDRPEFKHDPNITKGYPEWIDNLPAWIKTAIKKFGWMYGIYIAIVGFVFAAFGLFQLLHFRNMLLGVASIFDKDARTTFMPFYITTAIGILVTIAGIVFAICLKKWGRKR